MGLVLAIIVALGTVAVTVVIALVNGMSDAPSSQMRVWPVPTIGFALAGLLLLSHYHPLAW